MVAHQTPGVDLPLGLEKNFAQSREEFLTVVVVFENIVALVAAERARCTPVLFCECESA